MRLTPNDRGMRLSRQEIEEISREVALHVTASPPLEVLRQATGIHLRSVMPDIFTAMINGGTNPYSWKEIYPNSGGTYQTPSMARSGTTSVNPAYELNGSTTVASGQRVRMWAASFDDSGAGQEYAFEVDTPTGFTGNISYCDGDGTIHTLHFVKGVLQSRT